MKAGTSEEEERAIRIADESLAIEYEVLPRMRERFAPSVPVYSHLYQQMPLPEAAVARFNEICLKPAPDADGAGSATATATVSAYARDDTAAGGGARVVQVPPVCEPMLHVLTEVRLEGKLGMLVLTSYRVVFIPAKVMLYQRLLEWGKDRPSTWLGVKNELRSEFGRRAVAEYKADIRRVMQFMDMDDGGFENGSDSHPWVGESSLWATVISLPIATLAKVTVVDVHAEEDLQADDQARSGARLASADASAELAELPEDQQVLSTMTLHCKTCKTLTIDVLTTAIANAFTKSVSLVPNGAAAVLSRAGLFSQELKWLRGDNSFGPDLLRFGRCTFDTLYGKHRLKLTREDAAGVHQPLWGRRAPSVSSLSLEVALCFMEFIMTTVRHSDDA